MKAAIYKIQGLKDYMILLPDHTVTIGTNSSIRTFLLKFKEIDFNQTFRNGAEGTWHEDDPLIRKPTSKNCAYITDTGELVVYEPAILDYIRSNYISTPEYAALYGKTDQQIKNFCVNNRMPGAKKVAGRWIVPEDAPYPEDRRITTIDPETGRPGKYIGVHRKKY